MLMFPMADAAESTATRTHWVLYDDGSTGRIETTAEGDPQLSKPGRIVPEGEYQARVGAMEAQRAAHRVEVEDAQAQRTRQDYDALIEAGIPDATARRLSEYEGE